MELQTIKQLASPILKKHGIVRAALFGSATRNEMQKNSDVDMLVELPHAIHGYDYVALRIELQEELEAALGKHVDLVEYKLIKPELKQYILPSQIPLL
jgi:predicted nucleotidyltransferase